MKSGKPHQPESREGWGFFHRGQIKGLLFFLLCLDAGLFLWRGEWNDGFDCLAWILLLWLYRLELQPAKRTISWGKRLRWMRALLVGVVAFAELSYLLEEAWLDGVYAVEWLLVIGLFEIETRYPFWVRPRQRLFRFLGAILFLSMVLVIILWIVRSEWFNAFDALLWSLVFLLIDLDGLGVGFRRPPDS